MDCIFCNSKISHAKSSVRQSYIASVNFEVNACVECNASYGELCDKDISLEDVYDAIYENKEVVPGYAAYSRLVNAALATDKPLEFLATSSEQYYALQAYISSLEKKALRILEVGCGLGYTSYALAKLGHTVTGLDISETSIRTAKEQFQNHNLEFLCEDYKQLKFSDYDLVIATELIEHLPFKELETFLNKLSSESSTYFITTPNRSFYFNSTQWKGDVPPVHFTWISESAVKKWCENQNKKAAFISLKEFYKDRYITNSYFDKFEFRPILSRDLKVIRFEKTSREVPITGFQKLLKVMKSASPLHKVAGKRGEIMAFIING